MVAREKRVARPASEWQAHMAAFEQSGLTMTAYARTHGLNLKTFGNARRRLSRQEALVPSAPAPGFKRVEVAPVVSACPYRIRFSDGVLLEVEPGCEGYTLSELIEVLRGSR